MGIVCLLFVPAGGAGGYSVFVICAGRWCWWV